MKNGPGVKNALNDASSLGCLRASSDRPCPNLIRSTGKVPDELNTKVVSIVHGASPGTTHIKRRIACLGDLAQGALSSLLLGRRLLLLTKRRETFFQRNGKRYQRVARIVGIDPRLDLW